MALAVFDGSLNPSSQLIFDPEGGSTVSIESTLASGGVLVFDQEDPEEIIDHPVAGDVLVMDREEASVVYGGESRQTSVFMDGSAIERDVAVIDSDGGDLVVISPDGPPGPKGATGDVGTQGPQGTPGADGAGAYFQTFYFAAPALEWHITHNQNHRALTVETLDTNGDPIVGYVQILSPNELLVQWYFPMAGSANVFR